MTWATIVITGVITVYAAPYIGQPLYCDHGQGLVYETGAPPWIALDVRLYQSGRVKCGDEIWLRFPSTYRTLKALALDAGPFEGYYVEDWPSFPIVADLPAHLSPFPGLSSPVSLFNYSAARRAFRVQQLHRKPRP